MLFTSAEATRLPWVEELDDPTLVERPELTDVERVLVTVLDPPALSRLLTSTVRGRDTTRVLLWLTRGAGAGEDTAGLVCRGLEPL